MITNLALDDAMRLLGGGRRRLTVVAVIGVAASVALVAVGAVGLLVSALL